MKGKDLYCIFPLILTPGCSKDIKLPSAAKATVMGNGAKCSWKQVGANVKLDLSALRPGDISGTNIFVVKLEGALQ